MLAELPFIGIEIAAPDLNIGASLCTLIKMCYISKHSLAAVWMDKNLPAYAEMEDISKKIPLRFKKKNGAYTEKENIPKKISSASGRRRVGAWPA